MAGSTARIDYTGEIFGRLQVEREIDPLIGPDGRRRHCRWATASEQNRNKRPRKRNQRGTFELHF